MKFYFGAVFVLILQPWDIDSKELPSFIKKCKRNDQNLNECMQAAIMHMIPHLQKGVKELKLPSFNPYYVPNAHITSSWMNGTFSNLTMGYTNNYNIKFVQMNLDENPFIKTEYVHPHLELNAHYELYGSLQQLRLHGEGEFELTLNDTTSTLMLEAHKIKRNGKEYMKIDKATYKITDTNILYVNLHNLFGNNQELTDRINALFLQDKQVYYEEFSPLVEKIVQEICHSWFKGVFDTFSLDELFD